MARDNPSDGDAAHPVLTSRQARDVLAVALIVVGAVGVAVVAWLWQPLVGGLTVSVMTAAAGVALGLER